MVGQQVAQKLQHMTKLQALQIQQTAEQQHLILQHQTTQETTTYGYKVEALETKQEM